MSRESQRHRCGGRVQPFGGEGLSGTGPKAGGPLYLHRLVRAAQTPLLAHPQAPPARPALDEFSRWLDGSGRALLEGDEVIPLLARIQRYRFAALAGRSISLPGPTGEDNRIRFVPRGTVVGVAAGMAGLLHQIAAALASGNRIVLADSELAQRLHSALPELPARSVSLAADPWRRLCRCCCSMATATKPTLCGGASQHGKARSSRSSCPSTTTT